MKGSNDCDPIKQGNYEYTIEAPTTHIAANEQDPHAGEWVVVVTIKSDSITEHPKAQSFPNSPFYGATENEARIKGCEYGRKLILGIIEGLKI